MDGPSTDTPFFRSDFLDGYDADGTPPVVLTPPTMRELALQAQRLREAQGMAVELVGLDLPTRIGLAKRLRQPEPEPDQGGGVDVDVDDLGTGRGEGRETDTPDGGRDDADSRNPALFAPAPELPPVPDLPGAEPEPEPLPPPPSAPTLLDLFAAPAHQAMPGLFARQQYLPPWLHLSGGDHQP